MAKVEGKEHSKKTTYIFPYSTTYLEVSSLR
jgi:hypothetical protein